MHETVSDFGEFDEDIENEVNQNDNIDQTFHNLSQADNKRKSV